MDRSMMGNLDAVANESNQKHGMAAPGGTAGGGCFFARLFSLGTIWTAAGEAGL